MTKQLPFFENTILLINGYYGLIAIFLMMMGVLTTISIVEHIDFQEIVHLQRNTSIGKGLITDIFETNTSINKTSIYGYQYTFYSPSGDLSWLSYDLGYSYDVGDTIQIEYSNVRHDINRIRGMSNTPGGLTSILFSLPLLGGLIWMMINVTKGKRKKIIIENGLITDAILINKESTPVQINERIVYRMHFKFVANNGKEYKISTKTHQPEKLEDEQTEKLIYHSEDPKKAILIDDLPWPIPKYIKNNWC
mgnify:CR=1 FL=1|tara:strand:+ start:674 stop:1423 length:750 start_codon:yes stop_codon:yes gene_type:complete